MYAVRLVYADVRTQSDPGLHSELTVSLAPDYRNVNTCECDYAARLSSNWIDFGQAASGASKCQK